VAYLKSGPSRPDMELALLKTGCITDWALRQASAAESIVLPYRRRLCGFPKTLPRSQI
jgi:hypothetical protein